MIILYILDRYLTKKSDQDFITAWEGKIMKLRRFVPLMSLVYYITAVYVITQIVLYGNTSVIAGMVVFLVVALVYGYWFIRIFLRFVGKYSARYIQAKTGAPIDGFSKDNVIN